MSGSVSVFHVIVRLYFVFELGLGCGQLILITGAQHAWDSNTNSGRCEPSRTST